MSGPKSSSYEVSYNWRRDARRAAAAASWAAEQAAKEAARRRAAREAKERAEARQRAEFVGRANTLSAELSKAAGLWQQARGQHGADFPAWPHGEAPPDIDKIKDNDALEAVVRDLTERIAKARGAYAQQATMFKLRASLQAVSQVQAANTQAAASAAQEEAAQREEREQRRCAEEVSRLLETVTAEVSHEDRTAIEQRGQEAVELSQASRRRALLAQLRLDIQQANAAGQARQRMAEQAEQWRERLLGLEGTEVEELDRVLQQVAEGQAALPADMAQRVEGVVTRDRARQQAVQQAEQWRERLLGLEGTEVEELDRVLQQVAEGQAALPADMAQRVEGVVARATEASDREYALDVITEELENLGYVVETGFETASAEGSEMLLHKPGMEDDYHVSLQAEAGASLLHTKMVREASGRSERSAGRKRTDHQMERIWCQDFAAALAAAERRGVNGRIAKRVEAGEMPVQTIAPLKGKSKGKSKSKRRRTGQLESRAGN